MSLSPKEIAERRGGATKAGSGWTCKCPAHDDKHNSLSLSMKAGKLLWHCHAGCSQEAVQAALQAEGLLEAPAERQEPRRRTAGSGANGKPKLKPIAGGRADEPPPDDAEERDEGGKPADFRGATVYDYVDVNRTVVFRVCRFPGKQFRQARPVRGKWLWGLGRVAPIIYHLPEVTGAAGVYIVEGEKDADNLINQLGVVATTSPMGSGKWRDEYGAALAGKHLVILPDNDEPGLRHAYEVAANCHRHGAQSIRILELPGLPPKGDVSDWLAQGHVKEELSELVHATKAWRPDQGGGNPAWKRELLKDADDGKVFANEANLVMALEQAPALVDRVRYELFFNRVEARNLPWDITSGDWRPWTDTDTTAFAVWAQHEGINIQATRAYRPVELVGRNQPHHAPRDYLQGLKWDGTPRINQWLTFYLGAEPPAEAAPEAQEAYLAYLRAIGPKFLISAVARIMRPGCKVDTMLVIEGGQGRLKSTAIKALFGDGEWFSDHISPVGSKDSKEELAGKWCIEVSELSALQRADVEKIKAFLSTAIDNYRPSYGHLPRAFPRQCVFFGSTNEDAYLRDATGGRRFWPFKCGHIDIEALRKDRDQLWAEAVSRFHGGQQWHLLPEEEAQAGSEQKDRIETDVWGDVLDGWLAAPVNAGVTELTVRRVLGPDILGLGKDKWDRAAQTRVAQQLKLRGWVRKQRRLGKDDREWFYEKPANAAL